MALAPVIALVPAHARCQQCQQHNCHRPTHTISPCSLTNAPALPTRETSPRKDGPHSISLLFVCSPAVRRRTASNTCSMAKVTIGESSNTVFISSLGGQAAKGLEIEWRHWHATHSPVCQGRHVSCSGSCRGGCGDTQGVASRLMSACCYNWRIRG